MESNQSNNTSDEDAVAELLTLTCVADKHGTKYYLNKEKLFHRIHGPAMIYEDGDQHWYKNGLRHRIDGPAIICTGGPIEFWIDGALLSREEFIQWQIENGIKPNK